MSIACTPRDLPCPPLSLLNGSSLFLDFDGTLIDIADRPDAVVVDPDLLELLAAVGERLEGRVAIISGRSIAQIDALLGQKMEALAVSGSHGSEHRWHGISAHPVRRPELQHVAREFENFSKSNPGTVAEIKSFGVALHYRMAADCEKRARALAHQLADETGLAVQDGDKVVELRVPGSDKGRALRLLMQRPMMKGTRPVFLGDDLTDEPAFGAAIELGGAAVLVGPNRSTAAHFNLPGPSAVRAWLAEYLR